ncbi:MAG: DNA topoisomerase 3 [Planctomycetota bacterium]|jgi:DNA topoisomerase-3|nr:DNA topoisomerase 3 [Planctomycetota bacterium]
MLYIAEKLELARAIVEALGGGDKKKGYYECGTNRVAWCYGHMLELYEPEDYDPAYGRWRLDQLPMFFIPWKKKPVAKSEDQLQVILKLVKEAAVVVNAGDPDPEGQLLVDEILQYAGYKGQVKRVLINDNTPALVRKAFANLRDNADFAGLSAAAEARQVADQGYGFNMTRLYTLAAKRQGYGGVLSVGRVQTPILGLVVRRDREHANHQKSAFFVIQGKFQVDGKEFIAAYRNKENDPRDDKGRLTDRDHAQAIADAVAGRPARIVSVDSGKGETPPPLPYNLLALQTDASRLHGLAPDKVKDITQTLREKHRLITYNRSDSRYLSEEQHADAPAVIAAIAANVPEFAGHVARTDPAIRSRAFDSSKVTAHHAIVPTREHADFTKLSIDEKRVYTLIARAYLVQFMPPRTWERTVAVLEVEGHTFVRISRIVLENGWKDFYSGDPRPEEEQDDETDSTSIPLTAGQDAICLSGDCVRKETTPKPLYTMASLLEDLTRVAQYDSDDTLRKILNDKDNDKAGEHGGIGTPATRDVIIRTLFDRGFIETVKKGKAQNVVSTAAGREFYDILPDSAKFPDMTAVWHQEQLEIERGEKSVDAFLDGLIAFIGGECARVVKDGLGLKIAFEKHPCPVCGNAMLRRKGGKGFFWSCSAYPDCKTTLPDVDGKPGARTDPRERPITSEVHKCAACGKGLVRRKGKDGHFWGCSGYPECKRTYRDIDGKPNYAVRAGPCRTGIPCQRPGRPTGAAGAS